MKQLFYSLIFLICVQAIAGTQTIFAGNVAVHDPSIVVVYKDASGNSYGENDAAKTRTKYYYIFGTMFGAAYSTDMLDWTSFRPSFEMNGQITRDYYNLVKPEADYAGHSGTSVEGNMWAADVIYNKKLKKWTMYYSLSGNAFKSSIILFTADKIEGPYKKAGDVVFGGFTNKQNSIARDDYKKVMGTSTIDGRYLMSNGEWNNDYSVSCIDPAVTYDEDGKLWMVYGSWSGGIYLLKLDENTGFRDYNFSYGTTGAKWDGTRLRDDKYFGNHLGGGYYVSGEGPYIEYMKDKDGKGYYYMFISYGFYSPEGGYSMRVFRSSTIDGIYKDVNGNDAVFDRWVQNYDNNVIDGFAIMENYKWNWWPTGSGEIANGHNSMLMDEDGNSYLVYHRKMDNGTAWHNVETHPLLFGSDGWPLAAPFEYRTGFNTSVRKYDAADIAGGYGFIAHRPQDYRNLATNKEEQVYLNADGGITGAFTGTWSYDYAGGKQFITLKTNEGTFNGVVSDMLLNDLSIRTVAFTAMNPQNELALWGYRYTNTKTTKTDEYIGGGKTIGATDYSLAFDDYAAFEKKSVSGDFEVEYVFDHYTQGVNNWDNWAIIVENGSDNWRMRADGYSTSTLSGSTVTYKTDWNGAIDYTTAFKNKEMKVVVRKIGTVINIFAYADGAMVYTATATGVKTANYDVSLAGESCYMNVKKVSSSSIVGRQSVGAVQEGGYYNNGFNVLKGESVTVRGDFTQKYHFANYHSNRSADVYDNYVFMISDGTTDMYLRADAYLGNAIGTATSVNDWGAADFLTLIHGADIDLTMERKGSTITYTAEITALDGKEYKSTITETGAPTGNLTIYPTCEESFVDIFEVESVIKHVSNPGNYVYINTTADMQYATAGNWDKGAVPSSIDTAIIRTGEAQVKTDIVTTMVKVEANGVVRMVGYYTVPNIMLQGGMLKVFTSGTTFGVNSNVQVEKASTIMAGSTTASPFLCDAVFSGSENLTKTSVGILQLQKSSPNFSGDWIVSEGKLRTRAAHSVGSGNVRVNGAATLDLEVVSGLAGCDTLLLESGATVTLDAAIDTVKNLKVNGVIIAKGSYSSSNFPVGITGVGTLVVLNGDAITATLMSKKVSGVVFEVFPNPMTLNGGIKYASKFTGDHKLVIYSGTKTENARTIPLEDNSGIVKFSSLGLVESGVYVAILYNGKKEIGRMSFYY